MVFHTNWALKTGKIFICFFMLFERKPETQEEAYFIFKVPDFFFFLLAQFVGSIFSIDLIAHHAAPSSFPLGGKKPPHSAE